MGGHFQAHVQVAYPVAGLAGRHHGPNLTCELLFLPQERC